MACSNDEGSNTTGSSLGLPDDTPRKKMFLTQNKYNGNLGGIAGADSKCMSDPQKPNDGKTYKAFIVGGTGTSERRACQSYLCETNNLNEHLNWILDVNTTYTRPDGTASWRTASNRKVFSIFLNRFVTTNTEDAREFWTGMLGTWETALNLTCNNWTLSNPLYRGLAGNAYADTEGYFVEDGGQETCDTQRKLLCVEQ
ncbi:MAG: DUF1554 domain-containing protein [Leptospiraceae bacterium]|nr:DUF1554 domain-containing protein [Leptospiraceae bacterium]